MPNDWQTNYEKLMLALVVWREARNQPPNAMCAVAWTVRNRVNKPGWWGNDWISVMTRHAQFSSMTISGDPNTVRWPQMTDDSWIDCQQISTEVYEGQSADPTSGATYYFDKSLDSNPPAWAAQMQHAADIGDFHFFRGD